MTSKQKIDRYFRSLSKAMRGVKITNGHRELIPIDHAYKKATLTMIAASHIKNKIMFIGNGASAAISSHMASDYTKTAGWRSVCFNDGASLTCLANDFSYEEAFAKQIGYHAMDGDVLVAISSSGKSKNILNAVEIARRKGCIIYTFSGFSPDNPLRKLGDMNFYVPVSQYGLVEITHHAILHSILDIATEPL